MLFCSPPYKGFYVVMVAGDIECYMPSTKNIRDGGCHGLFKTIFSLHTHHSVNMVANLKLKVLVKIRFSFAKTIKDKLFPSPNKYISMSILLFLAQLNLSSLSVVVVCY